MNIHQKILRFIESIHPISERMRNEIMESFYEKTIEKDSYFLATDEELQEVGFIHKGLFRYYYLDSEGKEATKYFVRENDFVLSFAALKGVKSPFFIQALETSRLVCIKAKVLKTLIDQHWDWLKLYAALLEESYLIKEKREADFLMFNASKRYEIFNNEYPTLTGRVQQQYIASYLGITPESLSRILRNKS